jgi:hypothetical protein
MIAVTGGHLVEQGMIAQTSATVLSNLAEVLKVQQAKIVLKAIARRLTLGVKALLIIVSAKILVDRVHRKSVHPTIIHATVCLMKVRYAQWHSIQKTIVLQRL